MSDDIIDIFSGLPLRDARLANRPPLPAPPKRKKPYKAYEVAEQSQWKLKINHFTMGTRLLSYSCQNEIRLTPDDSRLDILFRGLDMVVLLWGKRLGCLIDPLQEHKVHSIHVFDARAYLKPKAAEPVFTNMTVGCVRLYTQWTADVFSSEKEEMAEHVNYLSDLEAKAAKTDP